jgi:hypothetical protein
LAGGTSTRLEANPSIAEIAESRKKTTLPATGWAIMMPSAQSVTLSTQPLKVGEKTRNATNDAAATRASQNQTERHGFLDAVSIEIRFISHYD